MPIESTRRVQLEFLRARLAEDEAAARAFLDWREAPRGGLSLRWDQVHSDQRAIGWGFTAVAAGVTPQVAAHIARWDPARVLAEVAAKRALLERATEFAFHRDWCARWAGLAFGGDDRCTCGGADEALEALAGILAQPHVAHPLMPEATP